MHSFKARTLEEIAIEHGVVGVRRLHLLIIRKEKQILRFSQNAKFPHTSSSIMLQANADIKPILSTYQHEKYDKSLLI